MQYGILLLQINASSFRGQDCRNDNLPKCQFVIFPVHSKIVWTIIVNSWVVGVAVGELFSNTPAEKNGRKKTLINPNP